MAESSLIHEELENLPAPASKVSVAVYRFDDRTGQFESSDSVQTLSRAVTQGASAILIKALKDAGRGEWFTVVEREGLENLLRERQIVRETRAIHGGGGALPPLLFAGVLIEGGIISYDTNTLTGGFGARLLGIGGSTQYRRDTVIIYLRAVSVNTGEVLVNVNVSKSIFAVAVAANVFRFVASDEIFELDAGVTVNEPEHLAIKKAIEKGVISLIFEGAAGGYWGFAKETPELRRKFETYLNEKTRIELDAPPPNWDPVGGSQAEVAQQRQQPAQPTQPVRVASQVVEPQRKSRVVRFQRSIDRTVQGTGDGS